ncbi:hypothetical protein [Clavibacter californiensis]|uniref:hypothetical protein n=1 Tax=Clavibacter californiensis TaxID=1401995 RepID=UPI001F37704C|nr:hypothetical protein [Clavibacter californiensis]UKF80637.1 hypothetical protein FGD68_03005 [Clavibacter californiensis]
MARRAGAAPPPRRRGRSGGSAGRGPTQLSQKAPGLDRARALEWIWTFLDHELADPAAGEPLFR